MATPTALPAAPAQPAGTRAIPDGDERSRLAITLAFHRDQIGLLNSALRRNRDIVQIRLVGTTLIMLNHPDYMQHVLVDHHENYDKDTVLYRAVRPVLRDGLIGAIGGEAWHRQRRLMQPSFHRPKTAAYVANMTGQTAAMLDRWRRDYPAGTAVDVGPELSRLALRIVCRTLFGADIGADADRMERSFRQANDILSAFFRFPFPPLSVPTPSHLRLRRLIGWLDAVVDRLIEQRRAPGYAGEDLLTALAEAVDEDTGERMTSRQLHEEVVNIMIGGYETSTQSASWLLYYAALHQDVQRRMQEELDAVLGGRPPTFEDLSRLTYTRMVIDETLRLNTPAWQTMRGVVEDDVIDGYPLPAGAGVYLNFYTLHRHPEFWPDPERFDPERFTPQQVAARHRSAYQPFATGPRNCIGKHFARTELHVIAAMVLQSHRLRLAPGPEIRPKPLITLCPDPGVRLLLEPR